MAAAEGARRFECLRRVSRGSAFAPAGAPQVQPKLGNERQVQAKVKHLVSRGRRSADNPYTSLGFDVPDIEAAICGLRSAGVERLRFSQFALDAHGIWTAPSGARVCWFADPDGNVLSLSQTAEQS